MSRYKKPGGHTWVPKPGFVSHIESCRRRRLREVGLLDPYPLYPISEALQRAGLE